jgi:uncharacterized protein YbjT (DUF2867 family)/uncharacterized protein YndB with AHSA1/START domain
MSISRVLVTGATGYIGGRLVPELLDAGYEVRCLARSPAKLDGRPWTDRVEVVRGDLADPPSLGAAMEGMDAAYFLVHGMGTADDFATRDREAAAAFRDAAAAAGLQQLVYLGGLGEDEGSLSEHLRSRHEVGATLAEGPVPVTELRAAVIIGSGSASFEMLRQLTEVLPAMVTPRWVRTRCQPTAIRDVLAYLVGVLGEPGAQGRVLEVGGPDIVSYQDMMELYAEVAGLRRRLVLPVPFLTPWLSSLWVGLVTSLPPGLARPLIESLENEVVVADHALEALLPRTRLSLREAVEVALERTRDLEVTTWWAGAELVGRGPADPMPTDPDWSGGAVFDDTKEVDTATPVHEVFRAVTGIGGHRGWYVTDPLWAVRGLADRVVGGPGMRRGRRHPDELRVGDPVDFFRVEALVPDRLLRLRAEMKVPGEAWLEWTMEPTADGTRLVQKARFQPRGLLGRAYWYSMLPFHHFIFAGLAKRLAQGPLPLRVA